jgi:hypothetical protein
MVNELDTRPRFTQGYHMRQIGTSIRTPVPAMDSPNLARVVNERIDSFFGCGDRLMVGIREAETVHDRHREIYNF